MRYRNIHDMRKQRITTRIRVTYLLALHTGQVGLELGPTHVLFRVIFNLTTFSCPHIVCCVDLHSSEGF